MIERTRVGKQPYTLLLGAGASISSGGMDWNNLCRKISENFGVKLPAKTDPIQFVTEKVLTNSPVSNDRFFALAPYFTGLHPSIGFSHLAQLIASGYFRTLLSGYK